MRFAIQTTRTEDFYAWIARRNSRHKKTLTGTWEGKPFEYTVATDDPHVLIGMRTHNDETTYELIGTRDLFAGVLAEITAEGFSVTHLTDPKPIEHRYGPEFRFFRYEPFRWNGDEWCDGLWIIKNVFNPAWRFTHDLYDEFGMFPGWHTLEDAECRLFQARTNPIIPDNPRQLRYWLDRWIEINACRIWNHIYETISKTKPIEEAQERANQIRVQFEALYLPNAMTELPRSPTHTNVDKFVENLEQVEAEKLPVEEFIVSVDEFEGISPEVAIARQAWDRAIVRWQEQSGTRRYRDEFLMEEFLNALKQMQETRPSIESDKPPLNLSIPPRLRASHRGIDVRRVQQLRDGLEKLRVGGNPNDKEIRWLLQLYGIAIKVCDIFGEPWHLARVEAETQYEKLIDIASDRRWTQSLVSMIGVMVADAFERIA